MTSRPPYLDIIAVSPGGQWDCGVPIAAARAGALGLLDLSYLPSASLVAPALRRLTAGAGGRVGQETTFVLLQRLLGSSDLPIYAWGGIGLYSAAACCAGGAAGVVLDWQLALMRESSLPRDFQRRIARTDGSETVAVPAPDGGYFRCYDRPGMTAADRLQSLAQRDADLEDANLEVRETSSTIRGDGGIPLLK